MNPLATDRSIVELNPAYKKEIHSVTPMASAIRRPTRPRPCGDLRWPGHSRQGRSLDAAIPVSRAGLPLEPAPPVRSVLAFSA